MKRLAVALAIFLLLSLGAAWWAFRPGLGVSVAAAAKQPPVTDAQALSTKAIANTDLPPEGTRSLFDHLVAQADGVPYPFEKLVGLIQKLDPAAAKPLVLMIPDGRSLLKAQADYLHPRVLVAADFQASNTAASLGLAPRGQLFLGFTGNANEIEVISYNEAAGRFEFQLVQDYRAKGARKLVYAKRAICTTCHQGGPPIFSVRPWNETSGQPETAAKIAATRKAAGEDPAQYLGFATSSALSVPERFQELADVGGFISATQKLWIDTCSDGSSGVACRRQMLKLGLAYARAPGDFDVKSAEVAQLIALQKTSKAKPIAVPQSDLANRDPLGEAKGIKGFFRSLFKPKLKLGDGAKTNEDLAAFDKLPKLPAAQDPLSPRAPQRLLTDADVDGIYGIASLFTGGDVATLNAAAGFDWKKIEAAVDALPESNFAPRPFSRVLVLQALLAPGVISAAGAAAAYCCLDVSDMSPPVASGEPPVQLAANSPIKPFSEHCFACHRGNPAKRLNFMSGKTEAEVTEHIKAKTEIRDALDWPRYTGTEKANKLMPPADSVQRAEVEADLKKNPQLLEQMRAVVPGLFDF